MAYQNPQNTGGGSAASPQKSKYFTYRSKVPGGQVGFTAGRGYYAKPGGTAKKPPVTDPYAALSDTTIQGMIDKYTSGYGKPATDSELQTQAQGQLDPLIAAITKTITERTQQGSQAIRTNSDALAKSLAGTDYQAPYRQAAQSQAATDAALHAALTGGGEGLANGLSSRLGSIAEPGAVNAAASAVAAEGAGAANASLASGSASLSQLLSNQASAGEYGAKQPGIAQLAGLQDIAGLQQAGQHDLSDQTAGILAKLPELVASLRNSRDTKQSEKSQLATHLMEFFAGQNQSRANARFQELVAKNKLGIDVARANATATHYANSDQTAADRAAESARHNTQSEAEKNRALNQRARALGITRKQLDERIRHDKKTEAGKSKGKMPNAALSKTYGYIVDQFGNAILKNGKKQPVATKAGSGEPTTIP